MWTVCLGEWENEQGDYVAYVRTAESEKEAAVRLFLFSVRSGPEEEDEEEAGLKPAHSVPFGKWVFRR